MLSESIDEYNHNPIFFNQIDTILGFSRNFCGIFRNVYIGTSSYCTWLKGLCSNYVYWSKSLILWKWKCNQNNRTSCIKTCQWYRSLSQVTRTLELYNLNFDPWSPCSVHTTKTKMIFCKFELFMMKFIFLFCYIKICIDSLKKSFKLWSNTFALKAEVCGQIPGETPTDFLNTGPQVNTITTRTVIDRSTSTDGGLFPGGTSTTLFRQGPLDRGFTLQQENALRQLPVDGIIPSEPRRTLPQELPLGDPLSGQPGRPLQVDTRGQCPTFLSRYEGDILVINLVPGTCDMQVSKLVKNGT